MLIFTTTSRDHALEGFQVRAMHYLVKPYSEEDLISLFDEILSRIPAPEKILELKINGSDLQVTYSTTVDSSKKVGEEGHYNNPNAYKSAEEITKEGAWSQVKMLRISAKDSVNCISMDASETIDIHYEVDREDETQEVGALVGSIINFGPCG